MSAKKISAGFKLFFSLQLFTGATFEHLLKMNFSGFSQKRGGHPDQSQPFLHEGLSFSANHRGFYILHVAWEQCLRFETGKSKSIILYYHLHLSIDRMRQMQNTLYLHYNAKNFVSHRQNEINRGETDFCRLFTSRRHLGNW